MRYCPLCYLAPREDDPMTTAHTPIGHVSCCTPCATLAAEGVHLLPMTYPVGARLPQTNAEQPPGSEVRYIRVCGVCRQALRDNDSPGTVGLEEGEIPGVKKGMYSACSECLDQARPYVAFRWMNQYHPDSRGNPDPDRPIIKDESQLVGMRDLT